MLDRIMGAWEALLQLRTEQTFNLALSLGFAVPSRLPQWS